VVDWRPVDDEGILVVRELTYVGLPASAFAFLYMRYVVQDFHPEAVVEPLLNVVVLHPVVHTIERCAGLTHLIQCRHHQHPTLVLSQDL